MWHLLAALRLSRYPGERWRGTSWAAATSLGPHMITHYSGGLRQAMLLPWRRAHCAKLIEFMKYGIRLRVRAPPNLAERRVSRWRDRAIAQCKRLWINYKCARTVFIGRSWLNPPAHHVMLTTPTMLAIYSRLWPADIALPSVESKCGPWNLGFVRLALEVQAR